MSTISDGLQPGLSELGGQPLRVRASRWLTSRWMLAGVAMLYFALCVECFVLVAPSFFAAQSTLLVSALLSGYLLADRQLLNPVQALLGYFYWWFGIGPIVMVGYNLTLGDPVRSEVLAGRYNIGTWIVCAGLPLYAWSARSALRWIGRRGSSIKLLQPKGDAFAPQTVAIFLVLWICSATVLQLYGGGIVAVNALGGTMTTIWWVGVLASISRFFLAFAKVTLLSYYVSPAAEQRRPRWLPVAALGVLGYCLYSGLFSGSKGEIIELGALAVVIYITRRQRVPWSALVVGFLAFLLFVEPFVRMGRMEGERQSVADRRELQVVLQRLLANPQVLIDQFDVHTVQIESPFRGIHVVAGQIAKTSGPFSGPLGGSTLGAGLMAVAPRALFPGKPDMNIGNVFSRVYGPDVGIGSERDTVNNIAPSLPFEVVANFGWVAGVMTFPLIGALWAAFAAILLSPRRIATHPLAPWLALNADKFEGALGPVLAWWRDLPLALLLLWLTRQAGRRHL